MTELHAFVNYCWAVVVVLAGAYGTIVTMVLKHDKKWHGWYLVPIAGMIALASSVFFQLLLLRQTALQASMLKPDSISTEIKSLTDYVVYGLSGSFVLFIVALCLLATGCAKPKDGAPGLNGQQGSSGAQGVAGTNGMQGAPGAQGIQGLQGQPGPNNVAEIIDPCGPTPGIDNEVFLLLSNGVLLWSESDNLNGTNTRLAEARDGNWITSDGSNCVFNISTIGNIRTITWPSFTKSWELL